MNLNINDFEGPLDLLLHLVRTAEMDIYTIDVKYIIDEYLKFINTIDKNDLDNASEYLVMASELIHLKSRLLLNIDSTEEDENDYSINSEEDLKNKLLEYEKYQSVTSAFKELEEKRGEFYTKTPENIRDFIEKKPELDGSMDPDLLKLALIELQKRMDYQKPLNTKITKKEISVEGRTSYIRDILKTRKTVKFLELFEDYSKEMIVATFLSILDMCKNKEVKLSQKSVFGDIIIEKV